MGGPPKTWPEISLNVTFTSSTPRIRTNLQQWETKTARESATIATVHPTRKARYYIPSPTGVNVDTNQPQKGNQNKWKTSHHKEKITAHIEMGKTFDVGDEGIWVTFARGMKKKAIREFKELCDEVRPEPNVGGMKLTKAVRGKDVRHS